ncbi:hypothetical protein [Avibacterium volantium]|uniref:RiboL-PSP-HEPN domain-containing protein n=1 Tax=Avibacterium volantium TaxID=762 RepID=A0A3S4KYV5_AVIVO|nr:hypothetical protein [Avibacterium volantium]VEB22849.1 Uncharacterised protein [Avibacterium volantium]
MTNKTKSYKGVIKTYDELPDEIKKFFRYAPNLIKAYPFEVVIAYLFIKIEEAQNRALYGGIIKLHKADTGVTKNIIEYEHLTREGFKNLYRNIFGKALPNHIVKKLEFAEKVRDKTIHGKDVSDSDLRKAICNCFSYAESMNTEIDKIAKFKPFGSMQGFKGRATPTMTTKTTQWLLKGFGFSVRR